MKAIVLNISKVKKLLQFLILFLASTVAQAQREKPGLIQIDSIHAKLEVTTGDTTTYKPVLQNTATGKLKRTYWNAFGGGSGISGLTAGRIPVAASSTTLTDYSTFFYSSGYLANTGYFTTSPKARFGDFTLSSYDVTQSFLGTNVYFDGSNHKYINNGYATYYYVINGEIIFYTAPSGTAGANATLTKKLGIGNTGVVFIGNGAPSDNPTDGAYIYAASGEMAVKDGSGNSTTISPHNFSGIPQGKSEEMAWAFYSEKDGKYINVDMLKLARLLEKLTGEKLVYMGDTKDKK